MTIRKIEHHSEDYKKMLRLRDEVLLDPIGVPHSFIDIEKEKDDSLIAAFDGNEMIGCCVLTTINHEVIQLRQMAVAKHLQGKKIGATIVEYTEAWAKEKSYNKIMMHARDVVIPFYQKSGYVIAGNGFEEVGIPHHTMEKILS